MNHEFDVLTKGLAQAVTRKQALKKFAIGLAGIALATFGLPQNTNADPGKGGHGIRGCDHCNPTTSRWWLVANEIHLAALNFSENSKQKHHGSPIQ